MCKIQGRAAWRELYSASEEKIEKEGKTTLQTITSPLRRSLSHRHSADLGELLEDRNNMNSFASFGSMLYDRICSFCDMIEFGVSVLREAVNEHFVCSTRTAHR
jgi:hypothetical protein